MVEEAGPSTDAGTKYLFGDGLGSTRLETNAAGGSVRCIDYAPFGLELPAGMGGRGSCYATMSYPSGTPDILDAKFTGKERDSETGLDWFESRYYSSAQGRFTSPDEFKGGFLDAFSGQGAFEAGPLPYANLTDPQTLNKYSYVRNNPLRYTDPNGHCVEVLSCTIELGGAGSVFGPVGTAVGGLIGAGIGAFAGYEIGTHLFPSTPATAQTPPSTSTPLDTSTPPSTATAAPGSQVVNSTAVPTQVPGFVADAGGNVVKVNPGSTVRPADNGNGVVYQPPTAAGAHPDANAVRVMGPTAAQPTGSVTVHGPTGQPINPATGKPDTRPNTHTPIVPKKPDDQQQ